MELNQEEEKRHSTVNDNYHVITQSVSDVVTVELSESNAAEERESDEDAKTDSKHLLSSVHSKPSDHNLNRTKAVSSTDSTTMTSVVSIQTMSKSETESMGEKDGESCLSSLTASSGVEVFDSSDIEIIKEDRGSVESIEILETSVSSSLFKSDEGSSFVSEKDSVVNSDGLSFVSCGDSSVNSTPLHILHSHINVDDDVLPVENTNALQDSGDTITLKSNSSNACLATSPNDDANDNSQVGSPCSNTSDSSAGVKSDTGYSKLQESVPSSCSPSPYESPTHAVSDSKTDVVAVERQSVVDNMRPDTLSLPRPLQYCDRQKLAKKESYSSLSEYSSRSGSMDALIEAATCTPLHAQGTVSVEGEMITFVAHGINELIKRSRADSSTDRWVNEVTPRSQSSSSLSSTTSGWSASVASKATRSPSSVQTQSPDEIPPIDPKALFDIEMHARKVAESLDLMMKNLVSRLHKMSSCTNNCLDVYKEAVDKTCDSVDANIKSMYALMAKCEELSKTIKPVYEIQDQIREIKRLLDLFEAQVSDDEP